MDLRPNRRRNYQAMNEPLTDEDAEVAAGGPTGADTQEEVVIADINAPQNVDADIAAAPITDADVADMRAAVEQARREQEYKRLSAELRQLKEPIRVPTSKTVPNKNERRALDITQVRNFEHVARTVDRQLNDLGLDGSYTSDTSDDSSSSSTDGSSDDDNKRSKKKKSRKKGKRKSKRRKHKSGKHKKITSNVVNPQMWPHAYLSLTYVSKDLKYDDLSLEEFSAGYASILEHPKLPPTELKARISHFKDLMYYTTKYTWASVLVFHAACLLEIERGNQKWGANFQTLMSTTLVPKFTSRSRNTSVAAGRASPQTGGNTIVLFCRDFQTGACTHKGDHNGLYKNETKFLRHICARCWLGRKTFAAHAENSPLCPDAPQPPPADE